ncbi:MAG: hypothetical protein LWX83_16590, partial [Anaerolineae bacterium]|nr:hypothetical protein [Anaerolineae bacterium]
YLDDWADIVAIHNYGFAGLDRYFLFDNRPGSGWTFYLFYPLFGINPLPWSILNIVLRFLMAAAMWWAFSALWPRHKFQTGMAAVLFVVYPLFQQQPAAVTYHQKYLQYLILFISLGLMIYAVRKPRWYWPFTLLSIVLTGASLTVSEFFVGLELVRPVIIWLLNGAKKLSWKQRLWKSLKQYAPYLLIFVFYVVWRIFLMEKPADDRNAPILLMGLLQHPRYYSLRLGNMMLLDFGEIVLWTWDKTLLPFLNNMGAPEVQQSFWVALAAFVVTLCGLFLYRHLTRDENENQAVFDDEPAPWFTWSIPLSLLLVLTAPLPGWAINRSFSDGGLYGDRFALAAMFGASLLIVAVFDWMYKRKEWVIVVVAFLVALSVGYHYRNSANYALSWERQLSFYWQLHWRAPALAPGTALISHGEGFSYTGDWPISSAINTLYPRYELRNQEVNYWYLILDDKFADQVKTSPEGAPFYFKHNSLEFNGVTDKLLATYYEPQTGACLWLLDDKDADNPALPQMTKNMLSYSNLNLIQSETILPDYYPPKALMGDEPRDQWCYYFQKAALARQLGDWHEVISLWQEAQQKDLAPQVGVELAPFIEAFAFQNEWEQALNLSLRAESLTPNMRPFLCSTWDRIKNEGPSTPAAVAAWKKAQGDFACR